MLPMGKSIPSIVLPPLLFRSWEFFMRGLSFLQMPGTEFFCGAALLCTYARACWSDLMHAELIIPRLHRVPSCISQDYEEQCDEA